MKMDWIGLSNLGKASTECNMKMTYLQIKGVMYCTKIAMKHLNKC